MIMKISEAWDIAINTIVKECVDPTPLELFFLLVILLMFGLFLSIVRKYETDNMD